MLTDDLKKVLNKEQYEAVTYGDGPLLVLAGAGSGKTRVLTYRYAYLVNYRNVPPYNILAITFTNKAAGEMKKRIGDMLGTTVISQWIGTFHACCGRILRRHGSVLGYDPHFTIYAESESLETVKAALKRLDLDEKQYPPRMMRALIEGYKDKMRSPEDVIEEADSYSEKINGRVYQEYQTILKNNNCMDFDDMILNTVALFQQHPEILDYYRNLFRYILVDEYQDTNRAQHRLVYLLAGKNGNICVVGDDDQSIYSFRGADVDNILNFETLYPGTAVIKLEQNYRSTGNILKIANELISKNNHRHDKALWTKSGPGARVVCRFAADHNEEAEFISAEIKNQVESGEAAYSDFAVLYRMNAVSTAIERTLTRMKIPYRVFGGMKFYDRKEIKDLVAYLRILANPSDEASLRRIINVPKRGIGDTTVDNISILASRAGTSMSEIIINADAFPALSRAKDKLKSFSDLIGKLTSNLGICETLTEFVEFVIDTTGLALEYEKENTPEGDAKAENIREFLSVTKTFEENLDESYDSAGTVFSEFLETVSLNTDLDSGDTDGTADESRVTLTTIHSAKGLEFPVVFVAGLEEGVFPSMQSFDTNDGLSEERRLMYVAVTRAMNKLYLSCSGSRMLYGKTQNYSPSRFLRDIDPDDLDITRSKYTSGFSAGNYSGRSYGVVDGYPGNGFKVNSGNSFSGYSGNSFSGYSSGSSGGNSGRPVFPRYISTPEKGSADYLTSVKPGERVRHKKYGDGTVQSSEKGDSGTIVEIVFDNSGMKRMILEYAKLQGI